MATAAIPVRARPDPKAEQRRLDKLKRQLEQEAALYAKIIIANWAGMGYAHVKEDMADKRGRLQRVRLERTFIDIRAPEIIWFKIQINRRTLFGYKRVIPYQVRVAELIDEGTIYELEHAIGRQITVIDDPTNGVYIGVNRLVGAGRIPKDVTYRETLALYPYDMSRGTLFLGVGERRSSHFIDLDDHPHVLIAGQTGSGKSNMVNNLICSLMILTDPDDLKFVLIDLKRVEFNFYKRAAHLYSDVIADAETALTALRNLLKEMDQRQKKFADRECKNLSTWNRLYPEESLPRVILVIDEFAALMLVDNKKMAQSVRVLIENMTNLGRSLGLHIWICTQYPISDVISNRIRINMPLIIAGRVQNMTQSRVILDNGDAAKLPMIKGRMVYQSGLDQHEIQTPFISDDDVRWAISIARGKYEGVLSMDADAPAIVPENLAKFIGDRGGALSDHVGHKLKEYGVTFEAYKRFRAAIIKQKIVTVAGYTYRIEKQSNTYRIVADLAPTVDRAPVAKVEPSRWILLANVPSTIAEMEAAKIAAESIQVTPQSPIARFMGDCVIKHIGARSTAKDLYAAYKRHCESLNIGPISQKSFGTALAELGFGRLKSDGKIVWLDLELSPFWRVELAA